MIQLLLCLLFTKSIMEPLSFTLRFMLLLTKFFHHNFLSIYICYAIEDISIFPNNISKSIYITESKYIT